MSGVQISLLGVYRVVSGRAQIRGIYEDIGPLRRLWKISKFSNFPPNHFLWLCNTTRFAVPNLTVNLSLSKTLTKLDSKHILYDLAIRVALKFPDLAILNVYLIFSLCVNRVRF